MFELNIKVSNIDIALLHNVLQSVTCEIKFHTVASIAGRIAMSWYYSKQKAGNISALMPLMTKGAMLVVLCLCIGAISVIAHLNYQDSINPKHVYGTWLETGTPSYNSASIKFTDHGVYRNQRMISTQFDFDGKKIHVTTGSGVYIYQLSQANKIPQLRRIQPNSPTQRFVKKGYEHLIDKEDGGIAKRRRAALAEHFTEE